MVIRYVALEGPESGTYFRGRGKIVRGVAEIAVPDSFRMVTDAEGLSIQVTPIGEMATVAVWRIGLDEDRREGLPERRVLLHWSTACEGATSI